MIHIMGLSQEAQGMHPARRAEAFTGFGRSHKNYD